MILCYTIIYDSIVANLSQYNEEYVFIRDVLFILKMLFGIVLMCPNNVPSYCNCEYSVVPA
jgi:uncharacterized membrane protein